MAIQIVYPSNKPMMPNELEAFRKANFRAGQSPSSWLEWAERLRDAAEVIFVSEASKETQYLEAYAVAVDEARKGSGIAEVRSDPPNYLPGQMLCAFALENALKGLMVANDPSLMDDTKLNRLIVCHDLSALAKAANFALDGDEARVLQALTELGVWAGRYPTATSLAGHANIEPLSDPHVLLAFGADHTTMRGVLTRAIDALTRVVGPRQFRYGTVVILDDADTAGDRN
jgi:hypothetical protein